MTEIEININRYSQNRLSNSDIMQWFDQSNLSVQKEIRDHLAMFIKQSHPTDEIVTDAILNAPIKDSMTPVVIFKTQTIDNAIRKIENLPNSELRKSIVIMLSIFKTADTFRRENFCKNKCTHEWHNLD